MQAHARTHKCAGGLLACRRHRPRRRLTDWLTLKKSTMSEGGYGKICCTRSAGHGAARHGMGMTFLHAQCLLGCRVTAGFWPQPGLTDWLWWAPHLDCVGKRPSIIMTVHRRISRRRSPRRALRCTPRHTTSAAAPPPRPRLRRTHPTQRTTCNRRPAPSTRACIPTRACAAPDVNMKAPLSTPSTSSSRSW